MKLFLSALENGVGDKLCEYTWLANIEKMPFQMKYNLMSYYYLRTKKQLEKAQWIRDHSKEILIDSGAHSFQKGKKVDWVKYTYDYANFIKNFDRPNVVGYFEMDVDVVVGYENVKELRKILMGVSDKIIPVWHRNRGIAEYINMCREFSGKIIAITGFRNEDISDEQYMMFLKKAKEYNCKVHCLGMTRTRVLDKVPFDYVDSSSWKQPVIYASAKINGKTRRIDSKWIKNAHNRDIAWLEAYKNGMKMQDYYYQKWRHINEK